MATPAWLQTDDISDEDLLKATRVAIAKILQFGQANNLRGHELTRADLPRLQELERDLRRRINARKGPAYNRGVRVRRP